MRTGFDRPLDILPASGATLASSTQARLLGVARSTVYRAPQPVPASDLTNMRRIDELHLEFPFAGSRMLRDLLRNLAVTRSN